MFELTPPPSTASSPPTPASDRGEFEPLRDGCGRRIDHLRLSVTSACDLRCLYCRPAAARSFDRNDLADLQRVELVRFFHRRYGLAQLRLTGGEPLLHPTLIPLIDELRAAAPALDLAMTTNGRRLARFAPDLRRAGLDRLNVSLDTLDPAIYRELTGGELAPVLDGIREAVAVGFPPPKINAVVLRDVNAGRLVELADWALAHGLEPRFLEAMPIGPAANYNREQFVPAEEILASLSAAFALTPLLRRPGETAQRFAVSTRAGLAGTARPLPAGVSLQDFCATGFQPVSPDIAKPFAPAESLSRRPAPCIGLIAPVSQRFCGQCRRMRLTADGRLFPCLLDERCESLRPAWSGGAFSPVVADRIVRAAVGGKQPAGPPMQTTAMVQLGG